MRQNLILSLLFTFLLVFCLYSPTVYATVDLLDRDDLCDVCEIVVDELEEELGKTKRSKSVLSTGYSIDAKGDMKAKNRIAFKNSEVRLLEALDKICEKPMEKYRTNYWNKDLPKFVKRQVDNPNKRGGDEMAEMFQVESQESDSAAGLLLNVREQLLNQFGHMTEDHNELKVACANLIERFEEPIQEWFKFHQDDKKLKEHLCVLHFRNEENVPCYYSDIEISRQFLAEDTKIADMDDDEDENKDGDEAKEEENRYDPADFDEFGNYDPDAAERRLEASRRNKLDQADSKFASKLDKIIPAGPVDLDDDDDVVVVDKETVQEAPKETESEKKAKEAIANAAKEQATQTLSDTEAQLTLDKYTYLIKALRLEYDALLAAKASKGTSDAYSKTDHAAIDKLLTKEGLAKDPSAVKTLSDYTDNLLSLIKTLKEA